MSINASSYIAGGGGFITETRYDGHPTSGVSTPGNHALNPRTKYVVVDIVGGGGGGQGGYNLNTATTSQYTERVGGYGGGGGGTILGLVYFIPASNTGYVGFQAGAAGLGSARDLPAFAGGKSYFHGVGEAHGGSAFNLTAAEIATRISSSVLDYNAATYGTNNDMPNNAGYQRSLFAGVYNTSSSYVLASSFSYSQYYMHVQSGAGNNVIEMSKGGGVYTQKEVGDRLPASVSLMLAGGNGGNGGTYYVNPASGQAAGNYTPKRSHENVTPNAFVQSNAKYLTALGGGEASVAHYRCATGGGGGNSLLATGGRGQVGYSLSQGTYSAGGNLTGNSQAGRLGSGGGGGSTNYDTTIMYPSGTGNYNARYIDIINGNSPGKNGGAGYVWIREFG